MSALMLILSAMFLNMLNAVVSEDKTEKLVSSLCSIEKLRLFYSVSDDLILNSEGEHP
jgi:hypothetical protein